MDSLTSRVSQGLVLCPILFNIYNNDIFLTLKGVDICNFEDGTTPYVCNSNLKTVLETLEHNSVLAIAWFEMNCMKLNTNKCHLLTSGNKNERMWAKLDRDIVWESNDVKLLRITLNNNLKFDKHVPNICSRTNRKLSALTRVATFLLFKKRRILFKSFIESLFKYCPLAWMFHGSQINDKISKLHTITSFE